MYSDGDLPKDFRDGSPITGGPAIKKLLKAARTGSEVTFYTEAREQGVKVLPWGVKFLDSGRQSLQVWCEIVVGDRETISAEIRYWLRNGAFGGHLKAASED